MAWLQDLFFLRSCLNSVRWSVAACGLSLVLVAGSVSADPEPEEPQEKAAAPEEQPVVAPSPVETMYDRVNVVGRVERIKNIPGSAHVVGVEQLERYDHTDVHRVLRQVPGLSLQEEEGFGLRPNIGIRGTGVERSQKILLLEDGVPIAPAPYSAPAAYYSPTAGRMEAIEVRKGSASIRQGPLTTGGAVNYVSTSIPQDLSARVDLSAGDDGTRKVRLNAGGSHGRLAFLVEGLRLESDGFKRLDGGGDTGFGLDDVMLKLRVTSSERARRYQALELKLGRAEQEGRETYLGLTREDFDRNPFRRYRGSQEDRIDTEHDQIQLRHFVQVSDNVDVTTTVYRNDFFRNWRKNESVLGVSNRSVLADPVRYAEEIAILRGDVDSADDALLVRNNRRNYFAEGIQSALSWRFEAAGVRHDVRAGFRVHRDEEDRFQEDDHFAIIDGRMVLTRAGAPGSQANRVAEAEAAAVFLEDEIAFGRWAITPGLRFESIDLARTDWSSDDPTRSGSTRTRENSVDVLIPGLGVTYSVRPEWQIFGSVHRGFTPPSPSSRPPTDAENSVNWELGTRLDRGGSRFEIVAFFNDYENLLGADTLSGGGVGTGDQFNGGAVDVYGLELGFSHEIEAGARTKIPLRLTYTHTQAEFRSSFTTSFADWAPEVVAGDHLPYLPEHQLFAEIGVTRDRWSLFLSADGVDEMRTQAGSGPVEEPFRIEGHWVLDVSGSIRFGDRYRVGLQVRNIADEVYVVARRPYGLRPGLPRTALASLSLTF